MKLKERIEKIKLFFNIEKELHVKSSELEQINMLKIELDDEIKRKKNEIEKLEDEINKNKKKIQLLKTESIELKYFINLNFQSQFKDFDYKVDITNCYIISINGKKYISLRTCSTDRSDYYTRATGYFVTETYRYYDVLSVDENRNYKFLYKYTQGDFQKKYYSDSEVYINKKHDYEVHILEVYPELINFIDNYVPNNYLKKIYYEINELGEKRLTKKI